MTRHYVGPLPRFGDGTFDERHRMVSISGNGRRAATESQAIMETAPHGTIPVSQEELLPLREVLADAIDMLPPLEREVFTAVAIERLSQRTAGRELGVRLGREFTHAGIAKIYVRACGMLRVLLEDQPQIVKYFEGWSVDDGETGD
jgi:hypothetical protein